MESYGEVLCDVGALLCRWNHADIRAASPRRDVSLNVSDYVDFLFLTSKGRNNKVSSRLTLGLKSDRHAEKLAILEVLRRYVHVLEKWSPPEGLRKKYDFYMKSATRILGSYDQRCTLPSQEELYMAMTA